MGPCSSTVGLEDVINKIVKRDVLGVLEGTVCCVTARDSQVNAKGARASSAKI